MYIPILKIKRGEIIGLSKIHDGLKSHVYPLFVAPPIEPEDEDEDVIIDPSFELEKIFKLIESNWDKPYLLDLWFYNPKGLFSGTISQSFFRTHQLATPCLPVFDPDVSNRCSVTASEVSRDIWLRAICNEIPDEDRLQNIVDSVICDEAPKGIVIDLGSITKESKSDKRRTAKLFITEVNRQVDQIAVACASFPEVSPNGNYQVFHCDRIEKELWAYLSSRFPNLIFSDYTVLSPTHKAFDPTKMSLGGKIRYTLDDEYLFVKGEGIKGGGYEQFRDLSKMLRKEPKFRKDFSWGDHYIDDCANGINSPGNQETWVRVAINQHIQFIANELAPQPDEDDL